jgi:hypothetical protein
MLRMQKIISHGLSTPWNIALLSTTVVFLDVQKADYELSWPLAYLKHHLSDFVKVTFFDDQDAEYDFEWPLNT